MSATNRGAQRNKYDSYQTPDYLCHQIIDMIDMDVVQSFFEPCRGAGNIFNLIPERVDRYWCEIDSKYRYVTDPDDPGNDYLLCGRNQSLPPVDLIITNPPYSKAQDFLDYSLVQAKSVLYLMRLNFWGSVKRKEWWANIAEPTHQFVIAPRPSFTDDGATDATEYSWFIWDFGKFLKAEESYRRFRVI